MVHWPADDPELGKLIAKVEQGQLYSMLSIPDQGLLLGGAIDGGLHWLYPSDIEKNRHLAHHRKGIFSIVKVGDNDLFCGGGDGVLSRWSITSGRVVESLPLSTAAIRKLCYFVSHNLLIAACSDHHIYALKADTLEVVSTTHAHDNSVFCLAISPDGGLVSSGRDARLKKWEVSAKGLSPSPLKNIPAHNATINDLAFSEDGKYLATASRDKTIRIWEASSLKLLKVAETIRDRGHVNSVNCLLWLDNQRLVTAGDDRRILEWEISD